MGPLTLNSTLKLRSGPEIPILGFGVWDSPTDLTTKSCLEAIKTGYRHIDTAQGYGNEKEVGAAIAKSGVPREDIYVTSKIWEKGADAEATYEKLLESVKKIGGEEGYVDLMLIHSPLAPGSEGVKEMWQAMEKLHAEGKFKSIGVSNFGIGHIENMKKYAKVWPPDVNQLELHPWCQQAEIVDYCHKNNIVVEAYCPLVRNQKANDPSLTTIAKKHDKTTPQVLLRYCLQKKWVPLPKSDSPTRIAQNADLYGFELDEGDMEKLDAQKQEAALVVAVDNEAA